MFSRNLGRELKLTLLMNSLLNTSVLALTLKESKAEKLKKFHDSAAQELYKHTLINEQARQKVLNEITQQNYLVDTVSNPSVVPDYQQAYWAQKFGIVPLLPQAYIEADPYDSHPSLTPGIITSVQPKVRDTHDWITQIADQCVLEPSKRLNQHFKIDGGTQSGKSTLVSYLLKLLAARLSEVEINLIDPKYPMTSWLIPPSFKGFHSVIEGVSAAIDKLEERKIEATSVYESGCPMPKWTRYIVVLDEWDTIHGNGKGYGDCINKDNVNTLKNMLSRLFKEAAAYEITLILIGQSPLSTDNGFSRSTFNNTTRIVLGTEALKWINDPGFPYKNLIDDLRLDSEELLRKQKRFCLVVPNGQRLPTVEEIPMIDLTNSKAIQVLTDWMLANRANITNDLIREAWYKLTQETLNDEQLSNLLRRVYRESANREKPKDADD
jgi:hypothetical protein